MPAKPKIEYQMVCAQHGTKGHSTHAHTIPKKDGPKQRAQRVLDANHHTEMLAARSAQRSSYYSGEIPWTIQEREVGKWVASD